MAQISVTINNRKYEIACDDGQEAHLTRLAQYVDKRVDELVAAVGQVGDARLLVMVSLLVADELSEVYTELDQLRNDRRPGSASAAAPPAFTASEIEGLAERIEKIAESLE
ncbi:MAG: cell division protein ZapA [Rhodospirillaceae bacterium]